MSISDKIILTVDRFWPLLSPRAAEARWKYNNAIARAQGCHCGKPATVCNMYQGYGIVGSVMPENWTCDEHADIEMWIGTTPLYRHTTYCPDFKMSGGKINGPTEWWGCPHKTH